MAEEQSMKLEYLLAALIEEAGGEIRVSYDALVKAHAETDRFLVMDIVEDGAALALSLADPEEIPEDVR